MRVMITGAAGFIGGFLVKHCVHAGCSVLGLGISEPADSWIGAEFECCDIRDAKRLLHLVTTFQPNRIFHLAAQSYPTVSLEQPRETIEVNVLGTINLFESVRIAGILPVIVVACSSAEYGPVAASDLPVREDHPLRPLHPYGVSKVAQDLLAAQYFSNYSIASVRIRIFNTTGPGKMGDVCSDLAKRVVEMELGMRPPALTVGNLTKRAIADVRDLVRGLWLAAEYCVPGDVYSLGGNDIYSVPQVIDTIRVYAKIDFSVERDAALVRTCDEPVIAGDVGKFRQCSGWKTEIPLAKTLEDMLAWWRERLASSLKADQNGEETRSSQVSSLSLPV